MSSREEGIITNGQVRGRTKGLEGKHVIKLLLLTTLASAGCLARAAVVRPTVFKGDSSPDELAGTQPGQQAAQAAPQPAPSHLQHQQNLHQANSQLPAPDGAQASQSTKISPLKSSFCAAAGGGRLDAPLGLQSLQVDDLALSASSRSNELVGPQFARLKLDFSGGGWCPERPISQSNFGKEWIQVKLNRSYVVSAIETQGRYYAGNGKEFAPSYQVEYSRNGGQSWHKWKDFHGSSLLRGNEDVNSIVKNELSPPIVGANVIRILPYSAHLRTVCLRFELHGCLYDEGAPVSYETNDGVIEPRWGHLVDYTYDGLKLPSPSVQGQLGGNHLSRGLGQLVDGVRGQDNFAFNAGFEWVGWKSMNGDVVIEFTFRTLRNFKGALFHSNNMFSSGVEVFQAVDVHYGIDVALSTESIRDALYEQQRRSPAGQQRAKVPPAPDQDQTTLWSNEVNNIEYEPDKKVENSRPVTVHLKNRFANKLRFVLKFASKWILISEVEFISQPVELLSLASCQEEDTPVLMAALQPAKTYDEYVAILREHQLRRTVTNAILRQNKATQQQQQQQPQLPLENATTDYYQEASSAGDDVRFISDSSLEQAASSSSVAPARRITGPAIPATGNGPTNPFWLNPGQNEQLAAPSINANLNRLLQNFAESASPTPANNNGDNFNNVLFGNKQEPEQELNLNLNLNSSSNASNRLGLPTVISLVFVGILLFLGLILAVSSYRLRCKHPKLGTPRLPGQNLHHHHHHHLVSAGGSSRGHPKGFRNFMSVFSSSSGSSSSASSSATNHNATATAAADYIFANPSSIAAATGSGNTLKKLDYNTAKRFMTSGHPAAASQLLVSVKDSGQRIGQPHNLFGFGSQTSAAKPQSINTQLIVGLNQANPLAQQQIYNNANNYSNQTYSMSMTSSSTNGHQGDYDYAIPDVSPMIAPLVPQGLHQAQQQYQLQAQHQLNLTNNFNNLNNNDSFHNNFNRQNFHNIDSG